jgi:hypothetical protein
VVDLIWERRNRFTIVLFAAILIATKRGLFPAAAGPAGKRAAPTLPRRVSFVSRSDRAAARMSSILQHDKQLMTSDNAEGLKVLTDGKVK